MKIEFNNLYTHFIFTTIHREPIILEAFRERVEKYITGTVNNNECQLYAIYANPEHLHFLVSRSPTRSEESLTEIVANSSANFINKNRFLSIFCNSLNIIKSIHSRKNTKNLLSFIKKR
jgi:REP element-mobilizing transposase RayT